MTKEHIQKYFARVFGDHIKAIHIIFKPCHSKFMIVHAKLCILIGEVLICKSYFIYT